MARHKVLGCLPSHSAIFELIEIVPVAFFKTYKAIASVLANKGHAGDGEIGDAINLIAEGVMSMPI